MSWTPELVDLLKKLWGSGLSAAKISEEISNKFSTRISRNAVIGKAHRLNLSAKIKPRAKKQGLRNRKYKYKKKQWIGMTYLFFIAYLFFFIC